MTLSITSSAFKNGSTIPAVYTCKGDDTSPALSWKDPPSNTKSFALIMEDPDAPGGIWVHWVIYNIPASARGLQAAAPTQAQLADGSLNGVNSWGELGYGGPCPPSGTHRYFFRLYALDAMLNLSSGANKGQVLSAMQNHILAQGELMGTVSK